MRIYYFHSGTLPSQSNESFRAINFCSALSQIGKNTEVTLLAQRKRNTAYEQVFSFYKINPTFSLVLLNVTKNIFLSFILRLSGFNWFLREAATPDVVLGSDFFALMLFLPGEPQVYIHINTKLDWLNKQIVKRIIKKENFRGVIVDVDEVKNFLISDFPHLKGKIFSSEQILNEKLRRLK